ncbi:PD-(D/E)XK endonuclease [Noviherbaspirillum humi]|uniref:PD-(D/E)XK endonuclease n=1 Tax=Noviherbaspirillum humi TaxID=1688639 RepID=A0A239FMG8_9BURK|nr:group I intron-associated PD-(D/E)XK endonuclease [Noviherbaspirillum humi]SNS58080.1 PD-(D/E)XK endonuclease [Noviherbaspirillum humi]
MAEQPSKATSATLKLEFAAECVRRGAVVSQPVGGNACYDLLVDTGASISKVQVKSASKAARGDHFLVNTTRKVPQMKRGSKGGSSRSVPYAEGTLDCIVTQVEGVWYFFANPHTLPSSAKIYPHADVDSRKGNQGREKWESVCLPNDFRGPAALPENG